MKDYVEVKYLENIISDVTIVIDACKDKLGKHFCDEGYYDGYKDACETIQYQLQKLINMANKDN